MIYCDLKLLKKLKYIKITEAAALTIEHNTFISSINFFNFLKFKLTSVK